MLPRGAGRQPAAHGGGGGRERPILAANAARDRSREFGEVPSVGAPAPRHGSKQSWCCISCTFV